MAHWYVIGASPDRLNEIHGLNHLVDVIEGPVDPETQNGLWRKLSSAAPDGLWITWEALEPPEWPGLRRLRVAQPSLPIVVEIPSDWAPPNPDLAQLVGLGIYGIVSESASFATATSRAYTYADVAHWQGGAGLSWEEADAEIEAKPKPVIEFRTIEKIVEKRIAASSRPVLIAVVGVSPGVGTTTTAIHVAQTLSNTGHDVALVESSNAPPALSKWEEELPTGITVFANPAPDPVELVRQREWPYIVVDGGAIGAWSEITPWQADLTVLVGPGDRHRSNRWDPLVMSLSRDYPVAIVAGAVVGGKDGSRIVEGLDGDGGLTAFVLPEAEGKKGDRAMLALLAPVLADGKGKRRWWRKSYAPALPDLPDLPVAVNASPPPKPDSDWKYTPSPSAVPAYAPSPTPTVNVQIASRGQGRSGMYRLWHGLIDAGILWVIASIIAWFLVLATAPGSKIPVHPGHWLIWAQWMTAVNGHLLSLLSRL